jgi:hypothetical protein
MLQIEQIDEWRGQEVRDQDDEKIGKLDEVFYDSASGEPRFISVTSGLFGRRSYLVALVNASVGREYVRVGYSAAQVQAVEASETDGQLDPQVLRAATETYGVPIVADTRFESSTLLSERQAQAAQARERADQLEQEAARRDQEAAERRDQAEEAARASARAARDRDDAIQAATTARAEADHAAADAPPLA